MSVFDLKGPMLGTQMQEKEVSDYLTYTFQDKSFPNRRRKPTSRA